MKENAGETEDSGNAEEDADAEGQTEIVTDLPEEEEVTTDEESGLTVSEVMDQAEDSGIDLIQWKKGKRLLYGKGSINPKYQESNCDQRSLLSVFGLWVWKLSDV